MPSAFADKQERKVKDGKNDNSTRQGSFKARPDAARRAILASAAKDATVSAKTLCAELGVRLGRLVSVRYDWTEIDVYSRTDYGMGGGCAEICESAPDIEPEDVEASDSAQFEWEILERDM